MKNKTKPVNNIPTVATFETYRFRDLPEFEVTIKKDGEIMYQNKTYAGCLAMVESIDRINLNDPEADEMPTIDGDTQVLFWGHPMISFFSLDQLQKKGKDAISICAIWWKKLLEMDKEEQIKHLLEVAKKNTIKKS